MAHSRLPLHAGMLLTALLLLGGCGGGLGLGRLGGGSDQVSYRCDDGRPLRVRYSDDRSRVTVEAGMQTYRLRLSDRDGRRRTYGAGGTRLVVDGDEARLRLENGRDFTGCRES